MNRLVLAFGSFDILHPGHIHYLSRARSLGDRLVVVVSRDDSITRIKGSKPIMGEKARVEIIGSLKMVDKAVLGNRLGKESDRYQILRRFRPNVIALGYDQKVDIAEMKRYLTKYRLVAKVVRLRTKVNEGVYKSSKLKRMLFG